MTDLVVTRWTRYGKDRLYVADAAGQRVGWQDLLTGDVVVERAELSTELHEALRDHPVGRRPVEVPAPSADVPEDVPEAAWTDLAVNRPGQGVRAEADSLLADMKAQSKVGTFLKRAFDVHTDERAFRVGADGEEAVGARLEKLVRHGWRVLHSLPVGTRGSDIDHLLIGRGGVYTVNTKRHPGGKVWVGQHQVRVNGQPTQYLRNSRFESDRVRMALLAGVGVEVPVRAVLVFLTGTVVPQVTVKQMPDDVLVLDRMDVPGAFRRAPERLTPDLVEQVYEVARRSTTWV